MKKQIKNILWLENILWRIYNVHEEPHSSSAVIRQALEEIMDLISQEDEKV